LTYTSRIEETLSPDILKHIHAPPRSSYPTFLPNDLVNFDAFLFGIPTRFGNFPAQWKTFWDATGSLWAKGALAGKMCGVFVSTESQGGGQEETVANSLSTFVHHGMIYVPLGYQNTFAQITNTTEVHGGAYFSQRCLGILIMTLYFGVDIQDHHGVQVHLLAQADPVSPRRSSLR